MGSGNPAGRFPTTQWNLVLIAGEQLSAESNDALATLCRTYWYPIYAFVRRQGYTPDQSQDLTQGFFARLLEKHYLRDYRRERGRFRSFLLGSLKHFLANERDWAYAAKRGGRTPVLSLDTLIEAGERRYSLEPQSNLTPESIFQKQWALAALDLVLKRLSEESPEFERLKGFLVGDEERIPYRQLAADLGISESAIKVRVHRLRHRFREVLREEISHTVSDPNDVQEEIRHLKSSLAVPL